MHLFERKTGAPVFTGTVEPKKGSHMSDPEVAKRGPYVCDEQPGDRWWCACGRSSTQPFCDGSHKGTDFRPIKVTLDAAKKIAWCGCKHSDDKPYCDGAHSRLP